MANKSVLSNQDVNSAGGSKHGYSLGQNFKFSMSTGMLLPVYSAFVNVGEKISGQPSFFIRADHLAAPVMGDVDVFVDCFFVPMRHLFAPFEQWLFQIDDNQTDLINSNQLNGYGSHHPVLNSGRHPFAFVTSSVWSERNIFGGSFGFDLHRLLMHLGYNPQALFTNLSSGTVIPRNHQAFAEQYLGVVGNTYSPNMPLYKLAAYQKIYYDYYRNTDFEPNNVHAYNYDSAYTTGSVTISSFGSPHTTKSGLLELHYRDINKDYFTAIHPAPLFSGIGMLQSARTLLSQMNNWLEVGNGVGNGVTVTPTMGETIVAQPAYGSLAVDSGDDEGRWNRATTVNTFGISGGSLYFSGDNKNFQVSGSGGLLHDHVFDTDKAYSSLSTSVLRGMFAFDKLLRITQRAGKHVDDQTLAHFGFKQPAGVSGETYVLKSYHSMFHFGEVTATAATNNADLGQMAGRGVAMLGDQKPFDFVAPCPGVFMAIISCAPRRVYVGAVEKDGFKCYLPDFFKPSIDNLGQQPLFLYETGIEGFAGDRCRWQYRFMEDKVKFDKASFVYTTNDKAPWAFAFEAPYIQDIDNVTSAYYARFKVKPTDINQVFVQGYQQLVDYPVNTDEDNNYMNFGVNYLTDPFNVDFSMNFKRVSMMSIYGEPVLGGIC